MATGDTNDFASRLRSVLPSGWFADTSPVLGAVLAGMGAAWAGVYSLYVWLVAQTRIATATDAMLDLISADFFAANLSRRFGEADAAFRSRIQSEMFRERTTRHAVVQVLTDLVGRTPVVFEPANTYDTGGYGAAGSSAVNGLAYGSAGGYGSMIMPFQFFVIGLRGSTSTIAGVAGYYYGTGWAGGGYGSGAIQYASLAQAEGQLTDATMEAAVAAVKPVATIAWMAITNASPWGVAPNAYTGRGAG